MWSSLRFKGLFCILCFTSFHLKKNYVWLFWVFIAVCGLSLVVVSGSSSSCSGQASRCDGFLLRSPDSRHASSEVVAHRLSSSLACGIFPDQRSNPHPLHLAGRFLTPGPAGKSYSFHFLKMDIIGGIISTEGTLCKFFDH